MFFLIKLSLIVLNGEEERIALVHIQDSVDDAQSYRACTLGFAKHK